VLDVYFQNADAQTLLPLRQDVILLVFRMESASCSRGPDSNLYRN
jgi:hypothetical protein